MLPELLWLSVFLCFSCWAAPTTRQPAIFLEFESCSFSVSEYKVQANSLLVLDWVIPLQKYQESEIEFVIFLTDVISGKVYGIRAIEPTEKNYEENSGLLKGSLQFAAPASDALVRFELRDGASTINSPFARLGNIVVGKFSSGEDEALSVKLEEEAKRTTGLSIDCLLEYQFNVTGSERNEGEMHPVKASFAKRVLEECGMIHLRGLYEEEFILNMKRGLLSYVCAYQEKSKVTLVRSCEGIPKWKNKTFVPIMSVNAEKRFEFVTPFEHPFNQIDAVANSIVLQIIGTVLAPEYVLESIGGFNAMPGASDQRWHIDNEHTLFSNFPNHPPYCSTLSVPLVACDKTSGCTEFSFKSHHCLDADHDGNRVEGKCPDAVNVWPTALPGDAIIYDPRIMHRGRANVGETDRPMLHNSYCHNWYSDQDNERGADALLHNLNKLGKIPEHIVEHMERNDRVFSRLGLQYMIKKMYTLYATNEEDLKSSNLPIVEAIDGTSTSVEIEMREFRP